MKALTEFAATREHIEYAVSVFRSGLMAESIDVEERRLEWIEKQIRQAWFNKNREYWTEYANGRNNGAFETRIDSDCVNRGFYAGNYHWFKARLEDAEQLLKKFDCAVDTCEALDIYLSDKDLTLLSVSLQSALEQ